jgi:hypothetical protein
MSRVIKMTTGCITYGYLTFDGSDPSSFKLCGNPECGNCTRMNNAIKQEAEKFLSKGDVDKFFEEDPEVTLKKMIKYLFDTGKIKLDQYIELQQIDDFEEKKKKLEEIIK